MWDDVGEIVVVYYTGWELLIKVDENDDGIYRMTAETASSSDIFRDELVKEDKWGADDEERWKDLQKFADKYKHYAATWDEVISVAEDDDNFAEVVNVSKWG